MPVVRPILLRQGNTGIVPEVRLERCYLSGFLCGKWFPVAAVDRFLSGCQRDVTVKFDISRTE